MTWCHMTFQVFFSCKYGITNIALKSSFSFMIWYQVTGERLFYFMKGLNVPFQSFSKIGDINFLKNLIWKRFKNLTSPSCWNFSYQNNFIFPSQILHWKGFFPSWTEANWLPGNCPFKFPFCAKLAFKRFLSFMNWCNVFIQVMFLQNFGRNQHCKFHIWKASFLHEQKHCVHSSGSFVQT